MMLIDELRQRSTDLFAELEPVTPAYIEASPANIMSVNGGTNLMDLAVDVRHIIYGHFFDLGGESLICACARSLSGCFHYDRSNTMTGRCFSRGGLHIRRSPLMYVKNTTIREEISDFVRNAIPATRFVFCSALCMADWLLTSDAKPRALIRLVTIRIMDVGKTAQRCCLSPDQMRLLPSPRSHKIEHLNTILVSEAKQALDLLPYAKAKINPIYFHHGRCEEYLHHLGVGLEMRITTELNDGDTAHPVNVKGYQIRIWQGKLVGAPTLLKQHAQRKKTREAEKQAKELEEKTKPKEWVVAKVE